MKICCISDSHTKHNEIKIPEGMDIILHAGDFSSMGGISETKAFMEWFSKQDAPHKIFISGNHDFLDHTNPTMFKELLQEYPNITYLRDEGIEICGVKIWGRPWTPDYKGWAFMLDRGSPKMLATLSVVPADTDILLTHGPALGILDRTLRGDQVGCEDMLNELKRIQPKYVVFGHIHECAGQTEVNGIKHVNAACLDARYQAKNSPIVIELP